MQSCSLSGTDDLHFLVFIGLAALDRLGLK